MSKRVLILEGGWSCERDISLLTAGDVYTTLTDQGYECARHDVTPRIDKLADTLQSFQPDVVFNALHGRWGEDGHIQGFLETQGVPYTHSGMLASALAMDKQRTKVLLESVGLKVAPGVLCQGVCGAGRLLAPDKNALKDVIVNKDKPVVCKPNDEGSSVGTFIFKNIDDILLPKWGFGPVLIESYIPGQEISVPVMDDRALGVLELKPMEGFYDYTAKYQEGKTDHIYPARLPTAVTQQAHEWAVKAHDVLGCEGVSRTDFRYNPEEGEEGLYVLEVNTQPGLTSLSIVPEVAAYEGISFAQLLIWMIENARKPRQ